MGIERLVDWGNQSKLWGLQFAAWSDKCHGQKRDSDVQEMELRYKEKNVIQKLPVTPETHILE